MAAASMVIENGAKIEPLNVPREPLPPERIAFCVDLGEEMSKVWLFNNHKTPRLDSFKELIRLFVRSKQLISNQHEFGLLVASPSPFWFCEFTSDSTAFLSSLSQLDVQGSMGPFPMGDLNKRMRDNIKGSPNAAKFVYRVILIHARSAIPAADSSPSPLVYGAHGNAGFVLDLIHVHEKPNKEIKQTYDILSPPFDPDHPSDSYSFDLSTAKRINWMFSALLAHPLIRLPLPTPAIKVT